MIFIYINNSINKSKKKHLGDIDKNIDNIPKKDVFYETLS